MLLAFLLSVWCCGVTAAAQTTAQSINADTLAYWVQTLSHDSMQGRRAGSLGNEFAMNVVVDEFTRLGLKRLQGMDGFYMPFSFRLANNDTITSNNIIGLLRAQKASNEYVIISAHLDHIGTAYDKKIYFPTNVSSLSADTIFNGANDNASGVAAMLSLAKYFSLLPPPQINILFIAFNAEEFGSVGSIIAANDFNKVKIKQVYNLEMLGRPSNDHQSKPFIVCHRSFSSIIGELNKNISRNNTDPYFIPDPFPEQNLINRSDHTPFIQKRIPALTLMFSSPYENEYHYPGDEHTSMNFKAMAVMLQNFAAAITPILN